MNSASSPCPKCGAEITGTDSLGACPHCLMQAALDEPPELAKHQPTAEEWQQLADAFPHLVVEELVGIGGMGRVYKAQQPHLNRTVALKVLSPSRTSDPEWLERFTREARALARLSHPHIVQVYDFGEAPVPFLLMEFVDGVNLRQAMENGALTAREALAIVPKLCDALHYAHERGVLHRDIKPENILIDTEGRVKLVDFGLAKLREDGELSFTLTQSGTKLGTLAYMAPEQIERPHEVDHRADIYSLGVVFYEMLTGELPLGRFPSPSETSGVDPRLDGVVLRTLEKARERRFQTADDLRTGLQSAADGPAPVKRIDPPLNPLDFEFRTSSSLLGLPLLHIALGTDPSTGRQRQARGLVAIGTQATGVLAIGVIARGFLCLGILSMGLLSFGVCSVGLLFAYGVFGVGAYAVGNNVLGYVAAGVRASGVHAASLTGAVDSRAAAFGDFWLRSGTAPFLSIIALTMLVLMSVTAWAVWARHAKAGNRKAGLRLASFYLIMGLVGPIAFLSMPDAWTARPQFAKRLKEQAHKPQTSPTAPRSSSRVPEPAETTLAIAQQLIAGASRTDSLVARDAAIREIIAAIGSEDDDRMSGGLRAAASIGHIRFDKTELRQAVSPHLDSKNPYIRAKAVLALIAADPQPADHQRILALVPNARPPEWGALALAVGEISKRDYTGSYSRPMMHLVAQGMDAALRGLGDARDVLGPLWGGKFSPELERKVIEWSYLQPGPLGVISAGGIGYDAFYHALSTQANKSSASIRRLIELADHPDITNIAGRCLWGMRGTVADPADQATVAAAVLQLLEQRTDDYLWKQGLTLLADYATRPHLPAIKALASRTALPPDQRDKLLQISEKILQKQP